MATTAEIERVEAKIIAQQGAKLCDKYDYLIAMRFHACLLGLKYGIKTLAISYDPKVETLAQNAKIPYLVMDSKKNDYKQAFENLEKLSSFNLLNYANSQEFEWYKTGIDELVKS